MLLGPQQRPQPCCYPVNRKQLKAHLSVALKKKKKGFLPAHKQEKNLKEETLLKDMQNC